MKHHMINQYRQANLDQHCFDDFSLQPSHAVQFILGSAVTAVIALTLFAFCAY